MLYPGGDGLAATASISICQRGSASAATTRTEEATRRDPSV